MDEIALLSERLIVSRRDFITSRRCEGEASLPCAKMDALAKHESRIAPSTTDAIRRKCIIKPPIKLRMKTEG
jgi:hypothetical protein